MKTLNIPFEDEEYMRLEKAKGEMTWREFIMTLAVKEAEKHENKLNRIDNRK